MISIITINVHANMVLNLKPAMLSRGMPRLCDTYIRNWGTASCGVSVNVGMQRPAPRVSDTMNWVRSTDVAELKPSSLLVLGRRSWVCK